MNLRKLMPKLAFFVALATIPLTAHVDFNQSEVAQLDSINSAAASFCCGRHRHRRSNEVLQAFGKLSSSPTIGNLIITNPQTSVPPTTGWQPFPVNTFSNAVNTTAADPTNATINLRLSGTYLVNALLTLSYPVETGPRDLTNYAIGIIVNGELQEDSIGSLHISTEDRGENPGLLFSANLSDLVTVPENSTIQFVVSGGTGAARDVILEVVSANGTVVKVGT